MRARHARQIRAGIARARLVREIFDAMILDPTTLGALALANVVSRLTDEDTTALETRAYLRTRLRERHPRTPDLHEQEPKL